MAQIDHKELLATAREHFRESNYQIAEQLLQQVLLTDARDPEVYYMLGTIYYDQGKFNKAIRTFRRSLEIDPAFTDSSVGLSIILNDIGKYDEGRKVFEEAQQALKKKQQSGETGSNEKLALKHDELGEMYFQGRQYQDAIEQYERALQLSSRRAELRMKIVECLMRMGEEARSLRELKSLVQEYPQFAPARLKLGLLYYNAKKVVDAIEQWENILLRDPDHPVARKYLQMAQEAGAATLL